MADFPKISFEVSLEPTKAFPQDARIYCESYEEALRKAQAAGEVGSNTAKYYYGQVLEVIEDGRSSLYQIQPDHTLSKLISMMAVEEPKVEEKDIIIDVLHFFGAIDTLGVNLPYNAELGDMIYFCFNFKTSSNFYIKSGSYIGFNSTKVLAPNSFHEFIGIWNGQAWAFVVNSIALRNA